MGATVMAERRSAGEDVMTESMPSFTTESEFNQYSFNLSKQLKSIKLNTLRSAMAKAAGFSHLDAFIAHLNAQGASEDPDLHVQMDKRIFVRKQNGMLSFRCPANVNMDDPNVETVAWRALESQRMTGNADFLDDLKIITVDGKTYLHGNVRDHKLDKLDLDLWKKALGHFLGQHKELCPGYWASKNLEDILLATLADPNQMLNAWLRERLQSHMWGVPVSLEGMNKKSKAGEGFPYGNHLKNMVVMNFCPVKYQMEWDDIISDPAYRGTTDEEKKDALATSLLNRKMVNMIATAFNVVIAIDGRETVKAMDGKEFASAARRNKLAIKDHLPVTFFADRVFQVHELERMV